MGIPPISLFSGGFVFISAKLDIFSSCYKMLGKGFAFASKRARLNGFGLSQQFLRHARGTASIRRKPVGPDFVH